jgi:tetratricopeptide (TPR) repeat protein
MKAAIGRRRAALAFFLVGIVAGAHAPRAQPPSPEAIPSPIPRGTLDPGSAVKPLDDVLREIDSDRLSAAPLERYEAGDYDAAARLGLEVLTQAPGQHGLRFAVANSLAWTGRYDDATAQYRRLFGTAYDARARVGLANVLRWRGQAHLAEPYYLEALAGDPQNKDASDGLALAGRDLRPALTFRAARTDDKDLRRDELSLSYRRWSADRRWRLEAGVLGGRQHSSLGNRSPRGLFASAWSPALPLSPQVEAAYYDADVRGARLFGSVQVEPIRERLKLRLGRVDWGRAAFSAAATADELTANALGLAGEASFGVGTLRGRLDLYDISDGNQVVDGEAQLTPRWQALPWRLTWFGGVYVREADREDPRYWSPRPAYGVAFIGLQRHWSFERGELGASIRRGVALSSTAGDSWSGGVNGRIRLGPDLALGMEAWMVDAPRPGSYRVHHVGFFVQQLL